PAPRPEGFVLEGEEALMGVAWAKLEDLVEGVLAGRLQCPTMVSGVLALRTAQLTGSLDRLRLADAPWPARLALI
ncbi:MAG: ADP-ribose pyrophosphatase, partial [Propionibacteriaceae bacterium]|nr:ADP-ribose pyrophosphatase [Propionibacteriaceae bacterium]